MKNLTTKDLPSNAKRVFRGIIFDVWQWEQKMYDGSTQTFERLKRADSASVVGVVGQKIIIQHQEQPDSSEPFISLPSGRCEEGEAPVACAKREFLEETGYTSQDWRPWAVTEPFSKKILWKNHTFIARSCIKASEPALDAGEKISLELISFDDFLLLSENPRFRDREISLLLYKMRLHKSRGEALKRLLFSV